MPRATSSFATDRASRYLQAMCKHFAHKVPVDYDAQRGSAAMPYGSLAMHVNDGRLHFSIESADEEQLAKLKYVIDAHIVRFAFREKLERLDWN